MSRVILVHGWGYDKAIWTAVRALLPASLAVETLDLGFFGAASPVPEPGGDVVAVGHSLGVLWWLTQTAVPWRRMLSINGFPRFTETGGYAPAVHPRVLRRMQIQLARDPDGVLADFHDRCGGHAPAAPPDAARLAAGLDQLAAGDGRAVLAARRQDVHALAGSDDPIVPQAMSVQAFAGGLLEVVEASGHLLPVTHAALCARRIERLAA